MVLCETGVWEAGDRVPSSGMILRWRFSRVICILVRLFWIMVATRVWRFASQQEGAKVDVTGERAPVAPPSARAPLVNQGIPFNKELKRAFFFVLKFFGMVETDPLEA